jgi:hypothetical protein
MTPWFLDFDPNTLVVSKMLVWVCFPNLPLHFWHSNFMNLNNFIQIGSKD